MDDQPINPNLNQEQYWYHGTDLRGVHNILESGPRPGRIEGNLGRGFYVTSNKAFARMFGPYVIGGRLPHGTNIAWHDSHLDYIEEAWDKAEETGEPEEPGFPIHDHYHQALVDSTGADAVGSRETEEVNLFEPKDFEFDHLTEYDPEDFQGKSAHTTRLD
jgi:hypothetical protein